MTLLHVDLCTGLGGWKAPFEDSDRWRSVGVDIREDLNADVVGDVRHLPINATPDLITMSPPCIEFTKWKLPWFGDGACSGNPSMDLVEACMNVVDELEPEWWILENVVGLHMYWRESRKRVGPYYFWGDFPPFDAETVWKQQRLQPKERRSELSAKIPYHVADALRRSVEVYS
jgi:hypothetical protein